MNWFSLTVGLLILLDPIYSSCEINLYTNIVGKHPLVLTNKKLLTPTNDDGEITILQNQTITIACPGANNYFTNPRGQVWKATCFNKKFLLPGHQKSYSFKDLGCDSLPESQAIDTKLFCQNGSNILKLGFQIDSQTFVHLIEICFNPKQSITYWAKHELKYTKRGCPVNNPNKENWRATFFNIDVEKFYKNHASKQLHRGHLTPKCDFGTESEREMTYYYINCAPQYGPLNSGKWLSLENKIRKAIKNSNQHLDIYTGISGIEKLLDGVLIQPAYFWKVVIEPNSGNGVAFMAKNSDPPGTCPCGNSICNQINWLNASNSTKSRKPPTPPKSFMCCCMVDSLQNIQNVRAPTFTGYSGQLLTHI